VRGFKCPVDCTYLDVEVDSLAEYVSIVSGLPLNSTFWFRGHRDASWHLEPSALRFEELGKREVALKLLDEFRRIAETKLERIPGADEHLKWMQLAQHFGLPTRLLDWTEVATFALYFACENPVGESSEVNGAVFLFDPRHISFLKMHPGTSSLDAHMDSMLTADYFQLGGKEQTRGLPTIAIRPVWSVARLVMQRSAFTLHGSKTFRLDRKQAPSLVGIPILGIHKKELQRELQSIGVDAMTLFPELEYACTSLLARAGLY